jgi:MFS family permease
VQGPLGAGAFSLSAFFLRPWAGGLGDRWGRRPLMVLGAAVFTASVLGYGTASSPQALAGLRLLTGAGEAFFFVGALAAVADLAPPQRRGEARAWPRCRCMSGSALARSSVSWRSSGSGSRRRGRSPPPLGWPRRSSRCACPTPAPPARFPSRGARPLATASSTGPASYPAWCC